MQWLGPFRTFLKNSRLYNFNQVDRDRWVLGHLEALAPKTAILDIGAGSAPYRRFLTHCDYKAQDFAQLPDHLLLGHQGYSALDYVCDASAIPVPDGTFGAILCTEVLEHVAEPIKVVREISRLLKPNGLAIITAPLGSGLHQEPHHYYGGYTPYWYRRHLTDAGLEIIEMQANGGFFKFFGQESIRFVRLSAPWRLPQPWIARVAWAPVWVLIAPFAAGIIPPLCTYLDQFDHHKGFTVGYHIVARKRLPATGVA